MSSTDDKATTARRPHDSEASRAALLRAAREVFDECGYDRATTRQIGARAGVDPALIARYFEGKEGLFLAAIASMADDEELEIGPEQVVALLLERWEQLGQSPISRALASPSLSAEMRDRVSEIIRDVTLRRPVAELAERELEQPRLVAELLVALAVGIAVTRANGTLEELAAAPLELVLETLSPLLEAATAGDA